MSDMAIGRVGTVSFLPTWTVPAPGPGAGASPSAGAASLPPAGLPRGSVPATGGSMADFPPGSPEAALYQDLNTQPGLPPQWIQAFRELPAAEQRAMGELYARMDAQQRPSFCCLEPQERLAMSRLVQRMGAAGQRAFLTQTPGEMRRSAALAVDLSPVQQQAFANRTLPEQQRLFQAYEGLREPGRAAFRALTSAQQLQFANLHAEAGRVDFRRPAGVATPSGAPPDFQQLPAAVRATLARLLTSGRLTQTGADGQTTLAHLDALRTAPLACPVGLGESQYRQILFNRLVTELDDPTAIFQGVNGTCGATCAQRELCRRSPADYAGFVTGLVSQAGKGRLPDGTVVKRPADVLGPPPKREIEGQTVTDNRFRLDRIVQASLMNHASPLTYADSKDSNTLAGVAVGSGLWGSGMATLYGAIRRSQPEVLAADSIAGLIDGGFVAGVSKDSLTLALRQQLQAHPDQTVPTGIHWNTKGKGLFGDDGHWIEVTRVSAKRVYFQNPHGNSFPASQQRNTMLPRDEVTDRRYIEKDGSDGSPPRRIYDDGSESVSRTWFDTSVESVVVDPQVAATEKARPSNRFDVGGLLGGR